MFELYDRESGNMIGEYESSADAFARVLTEVWLNGQVDLALGSIEGGREVMLGAGDDLLALARASVFRQVSF